MANRETAVFAPEEPAEKIIRSPYRTVFILLAIFTLLEIGASYLPELIKLPILIILAGTKAALVLLYFMHLKIDSPVFSIPMIIGAGVVVPIILIIVWVMPLMY